MKIIDRRHVSIGGHSQRKIQQIKYIAIHYSATATGHTKLFENYWRQNRGWMTGGYHEVVLLNGDVELNYDPTVISNGVKGYNTNTYHICYVGDGKPNNAQLKSLHKRVKRAKSAYRIQEQNIKGHREFSGANTLCPAVNVKSMIVNQLGSTVVQDILQTLKPKPKPNLIGKTANIQRWLNSYSMNNIVVDDLYGPKTYQALVKTYQFELNKQFNQKLIIDGISGPKTDAAAIAIRRGARGNLTKAMQAFLFFKGYTLAVDGIFGNITEEVVRSFQRDNRLAIDGISGKQTFKKLIRR